MSYTRQQWATDVLKSLGNANPSQSTVNWLVGWTDYETAPGQSAAYNLLNTTQPATGATNYNSVGVKNYTSYQQGIQATAQTLENGYYNALLADLRGNNANDLSLSPTVTQEIATWGTHKSGAQIAAVAGQGANNTYQGASMPANTVNTSTCSPTDLACIAGQVTGNVGSSTSQAAGSFWSGFWAPFTSVNWQDVGIRGGLILVGVVLVLAAIWKLMSSPEVVVEGEKS